MQFVFRCDASKEIGTGHVMRCVTLANELKKIGHECLFICRRHEGNLIGLIEAQGYNCYTLELELELEGIEEEHKTNHAHWLGCSQSYDAKVCKNILKNLACDWLIVDHYSLDITWESEVRCYSKYILVIDDLMDRYHDCDLLLDQNLGREVSSYSSLVPRECIQLIGTKYALLRSEFIQWRSYSLSRRKRKKGLDSILICMAGVDKDNYTSRVLLALQRVILSDCKVVVVLGGTAPHISDVKRNLEQLKCKTKLLIDVVNMAEIMAKVDLAIGAAGSSSWERCCLGLPSIVFAIADNQRSIAEFLERRRAAFSISDCSDLIKINEFYNNLDFMAISKLCDGLGVKRVITQMMRVCQL